MSHYFAGRGPGSSVGIATHYGLHGLSIDTLGITYATDAGG
jgi:hypothetical protein